MCLHHLWVPLQLLWALLLLYLPLWWKISFRFDQLPLGVSWGYFTPRSLHTYSFLLQSFPGGSDSKASTCNLGDLGSIPESGRSPGEGNGNPLQYSCLENPMDGGAWQSTVHGVSKSQTWLSDFTFTSCHRASLMLQWRTPVGTTLNWWYVCNLEVQQRPTFFFF